MKRLLLSLTCLVLLTPALSTGQGQIDPLFFKTMDPRIVKKHNLDKQLISPLHLNNRFSSFPEQKKDDGYKYLIERTKKRIRKLDPDVTGHNPKTKPDTMDPMITVEGDGPEPRITPPVTTTEPSPKGPRDDIMITVGGGGPEPRILLPATVTSESSAPNAGIASLEAIENHKNKDCEIDSWVENRLESLERIVETDEFNFNARNDSSCLREYTEKLIKEVISKHPAQQAIEAAKDMEHSQHPKQTLASCKVDKWLLEALEPLEIIVLNFSSSNGEFIPDKDCLSDYIKHVFDHTPDALAKTKHADQGNADEQ